MNSIVVNGREIEVSVPVERHPDLQFKPGSSGAMRRFERCRLGVLHWTGGEGSGPGVFHVLEGRGLSIQFTIDGQGRLWQYADPGKVVCAHAGRSVNSRSWGVEVVNYGCRAPGATIPEKGQDRPTYQCVIHGKLQLVADFRPEQYAAIEALFGAVNDALGIPRRVLADPFALVRWPDLSQLDGVVGHLHISPRKTDPGTKPLEWLAARAGWGRMVLP